MFKPGTDILIQEPHCETRRLRRSVVVEASEDGIAVRFPNEPPALDVDLDVLLYFNAPDDFVQQPARVVEVVEGPRGEPPIYRLEMLGEAVSASQREHERVNTVAVGIGARIAQELRVPVQDLSAKGLAVFASGRYELGEAVDVGLQYRDEVCEGVASVQSVREYGPGRIRYGLRAVEQDPCASRFLEVLERISLAVAREQSQRDRRDRRDGTG